MRRSRWPWKVSPRPVRRTALGVEALEERCLLSAGNLDPLFGSAGQAVLALGGNSQVNAVAVLADGNDTTADPILLAGQSSGGSGQAFTVARLQGNGQSLDPGFGTGGMLTVNFGGPAAAEAVALLPDQTKAVVGGYTTIGGQRAFALARLNTTTGQLDTSFNGTGTLVLGNLGGATLNALALERDGSVIAVGGSVVVHILNNGTLDSSFGTNGVFALAAGSGDEARAVAIQAIDNNVADDKIVVAGDAVFSHANGFNRDMVVVRLNANGTADAGFGSGGTATVDLGSGDDTARGVMVQTDGKIVIGGSAGDGRFDLLALARLTTAGALDPTFGAGTPGFGANGAGTPGTVVTAVGASSDIAFALAAQPDGNLVVAGRSLLQEDNPNSSVFTLARYLPNGQPDPTFGLGGHVTTPFSGGSSSANALAVGDNGQLIAAGFVGSPGATQAAVARYQADTRPIAQSTAFTVSSDGFGQPITILPLDNDFDPDGGTRLSVTQLSIPHDQSNPTDRSQDTIVLPGAAPTVLPDGSSFSTDGTRVIFTPPNGFTGTYTFYYSVSDGWLTDEARITVNVSTGGLRGGARDPGFGGPSGRVLTHLGFNNITAGSTVVQPDDKVVVAGLTTVNGQNQFAVVRYNADGSLDQTFHNGAAAVTDFANLAGLTPTVALQADGSIVVAGGTTVNGQFEFALVRFRADGSLDTSFGNNGEVVTAFTNLISLAPLSPAVAVQADGKIVVVGGGLDGSNNVDFAVARFASNGTLETTFGNGSGANAGEDLVNFNGGAALATAVLIQGSQIVVGGVTTAPSTPDATGQGQNFALVRLNSDGSLDTSFGVNGSGEIVTDVRGTDILRALALDNGQVVAVGTADNGGNRDFAVVRYAANGAAIDPTFHGGAPLTVDFQGQNDEAFGAVVQADGKIVVAGYATVVNPNNFLGTANKDFALIRLNADGSLDTSFGNGGKVTTDFIGRDNSAVGVVLQSSGNLVAAGSTFDIDPTQALGLVRYLASNGSVDSSFGGSVRGFGLVAAAPGTQTATDSAAHATAVQADGKVVAAGTAFNAAGNRDFALVRFNADGSPDTSFGSLGNGSVLLDFGGGDDVVNAVTLIPGEGQEILAAGYATIGGRREFALALFYPDGSLDTTFGNGGTVTLAVGAGAATINTVAVDDGGNLFVAGTALQNGRQVFALAHVILNGQTPGSLDPLFGTNGVVLTDLGANASAQGLTVQSDGKIVVTGTVGGGTAADVALARYNLDGSLDSSFGSGGTVRTDVGGADVASGIALQPDGSILVSGSTTTGSGSNAFVIRYQSNGQVDTSFGAGGTGAVVLSDLGADSRALAVLVQSFGPSDNRIVIAGAANVGGKDTLTLARLLSTGVEDTTFASNGKLSILGNSSGQFEALALQSDGNLIATGTASLQTGGPTRFVIGRFLGQAVGNLTPLAVADTATTAMNQAVTIPVLANDQDPNGEPLIVVGVGPQALPTIVTGNGGTVAVNADGTISYTPALTFTGTDTFTYTISGSGGMATATVTVNVVNTSAPSVPANLPALVTALSQQPGLVANAQFLALSSGSAAGVYSGTLNAFGGQPGTFAELTTGSLQTAVNGIQAGYDNGSVMTVEHLPGGTTVNRGLVYDPTILDLTLNVPAGANFISFDLAFLSNEFPGLLGRVGNDGFVAELDGTNWYVNPVTGAISALDPVTGLPTTPNNFAFDPQAPSRPAISVGSSFFSDRRVSTLTGTLYNAGTSQLTAGIPLTPSAVATTHHLYLSIFDVGNSQLRGQVDSAVFVRNLRAITLPGAATAGATQPPQAAADWAPLTPGAPTTVAVLANDLDLDNGALRVVAVTPPAHGTVVIDPGALTVTYTPAAGFSGTDTFTYTTADPRGENSTATVTLLPLVQSAASGAGAPTDTLGVSLPTGLVSSTLMRVTPGSGVTPLSLAQYSGNPTGMAFSAQSFFDVQSLAAGPADQVTLIVNVPEGGTLMYFDGTDWHSVLSSGGQPPTRLSSDQVMVVLDAFSFPRITGLLGTVFSIPVTTPPSTTTTTTVSTPVVQAGTTTTAGATTDLSFTSNVQLSIALTSHQSSLVQSGEATLSARLNQPTLDAETGTGGSSGGRPQSGDPDGADAVSSEVAWVYELHPEAFAELTDLYAQTGKVDNEDVERVVPLPVWMDVPAVSSTGSAGAGEVDPGGASQPGAGSVSPPAAPEEEDETSRLDRYFQAVPVLEENGGAVPPRTEDEATGASMWACAAFLSGLFCRPDRLRSKKRPPSLR